MPRKPEFLTAGQAARRLGVSPKALRLYEQHSLVTPGRTQAGWRAYGPDEIKTAEEIVSLRKLGLGLAEIASLLDCNPSSRSDVLARHQSRLEAQMRELGATLRNVSSARVDCRHRSTGSPVEPQIATLSFDLPWPWAGERFSLPDIQPLTYITGPLGSGKTRLAWRLAQALPGGQFLGLDRLDADGNSHMSCLESDAGLRRRCHAILHSLESNGATMSAALTVLIVALCSDETAPLVIDMVEQGLNGATQSAVSHLLRHRGHSARPLFLMTRSSAMLNLGLAESGETIIYCPANHSPPLIVHPDPLCAGYEAVATCLATPEARARTTGVIAAWATDATHTAP